jgi:glycosyltransferase involved in cell wall biosynthesis
LCEECRIKGFGWHSPELFRGQILNDRGSDIAILMMVYNHEAFVGESLDSLLRQTFQDFSILIVDDASTDRSFEIISGYQKKFKSCKILRNDKNKGAIGNFHYSTDVITKEYPQARFFFWTAPDDTWSPGYLEKTRAALIADPEAVVCQSGYDMLYLKDGKKTIHELQPLSAVDYRTARNVFYSHGSKNARTHYNNMLHGLMRFQDLRSVFPPDRALLSAALCAEISLSVAMLLRGKMITVGEVLYHKKKLGRFVDLHKHDELTIKSQKLGYMTNAVFKCLPWFFRINKRADNKTVLLLWGHLFYYYVFLSVRQRLKGACISVLKRPRQAEQETAG